MSILTKVHTVVVFYIAEWFHFTDVCLQSWKGGDYQNASLTSNKAKLSHQEQGLPDLNLVLRMNCFL